jgi:hypothetical protein
LRETLAEDGTGRNLPAQEQKFLALIDSIDPFDLELPVRGTGGIGLLIRLLPTRISCPVCLRFLQGCDGNNFLGK